MAGHPKWGDILHLKAKEGIKRSISFKKLIDEFIPEVAVVICKNHSLANKNRHIFTNLWGNMTFDGSVSLLTKQLGMMSAKTLEMVQNC